MEYEYQDCSVILLDAEYVIINLNPDGSISTFYDTTQNPLNPNYVPFELGQACCEVILEQTVAAAEYTGVTYTWDENLQQCKWLETVDCDVRPPFSVVLNPTPNGGALFEVEEGETCVLDVQFDYIFKFDCQNLLDVQLSGVTPQLLQLYEDLDDQINQCNALQEQLDALSGGTFNYVIPYYHIFTGVLISNLCLTSIGEALAQTFVVTEQGQEVWEEYLTTGDPATLNFPTLGLFIIAQQEYDATEVIYYEVCEDGEALIQETQGWLLATSQAEDALEACQNTVTTIQNTIDTILAEEAENCLYVIDAFEDLAVEMAIEIQNPISPSIISIPYSEEIYNSGAGNLFNYLVKNVQNPLYIEGYNGVTCTNDTCDEMAKILTQQLINEGVSDGTLTGSTYFSQYTQLLELTGDNPFGANWLTYSETITDPAVISGITGQEINLSIRVVDACVDFSILIDRITLNKVCERVINEDIFVSENPAFDITKVCDNKKSWVTMDVEDDREFLLPLRETEYSTNNSRLVINTKEVDLNLSITNGIETDVWCYITDNPCVLDPCTNSVYTGLTGTSCCCGQTPLSGTNITGGTVALPPVSAITPCERVVGQVGPAGGIVYWVNPDDPCEGYEVMTFDQSSGVTWGALGLVGGTSTEFATGEANTNLIIGTSTAAQTCVALSFNLYSDWFLPSIDDLLLIAANTNTLITNDIHIAYWSSSESDPDVFSPGANAWALKGGNDEPIKKTFDVSPANMRVRAVRHFDTNPCGGISGTINLALLVNGVDEEYTDCSWIYKFNVIPPLSIGDFNGVWLAGMPDDTLGVFYQITTSGGTGSTIDYSEVVSKECCESYNQLVQDYAWDTAKGSYYTEFRWDASCEQCKVVKCSDPHCVDFDDLLTSEVSGVTTIKEFNHILSSELVNVRCRKISSNYPTLRALYERYMNSTEYCEALSAQFDYSTMSDFTDLVGNYWVDLIEQVMPSTAIWEANQIYGNTIYDQQKFQYKGHSLFPCRVPQEQLVSGLEIRATGTVDVDLYTLTRDGLCEAYEQCTDVYYVTGDCGSEFLGTVIDPNNPVTIIGN